MFRILVLIPIVVFFLNLIPTTSYSADGSEGAAATPTPTTSATPEDPRITAWKRLCEPRVASMTEASCNDMLMRIADPSQGNSCQSIQTRIDDVNKSIREACPKAGFSTNDVSCAQNAVSCSNFLAEANKNVDECLEADTVTDAHCSDAIRRGNLNNCSALANARQSELAELIQDFERDHDKANDSSSRANRDLMRFQNDMFKAIKEGNAAQEKADARFEELAQDFEANLKKIKADAKNAYSKALAQLQEIAAARNELAAKVTEVNLQFEGLMAQQRMKCQGEVQKAYEARVQRGVPGGLAGVSNFKKKFIKEKFQECMTSVAVVEAVRFEEKKLKAILDGLRQQETAIGQAQQAIEKSMPEIYQAAIEQQVTLERNYQRDMQKARQESQRIRAENAQKQLLLQQELQQLNAAVDSEKEAVARESTRIKNLQCISRCVAAAGGSGSRSTAGESVGSIAEAIHSISGLMRDKLDACQSAQTNSCTGILNCPTNTERAEIQEAIQ